MDSLAPITFAVSAAVLVYVLAGYPLLLAFVTRKGRPVRKRLEWRTVSILLPVHNGGPWIRDKLRSILKLNYPRHLMEILVISDGSDDGTDEMVREFAGQGVQLVRIPHSGKALALNAGMERASGDILFFTDVRQLLEPDSLQNLVACLGDPEVGAASGELIILDGRTREEADIGLYWRYEKWIRSRLSAIDSVIGASGCIYAMRRELAVPLPPDTLLDDVYLPLAAFFKGYRIILDPSAKAFDYPAALNVEFRRKVRTLAGNHQLLTAWPALLGPSNRMWFHFLSHKVARLFLPYVLVILAISSLGLPGMWATLAVGVQVAFYALAAADLRVPQTWRLKRLSSLARTFVILMAAAACAISIIFRPGRALWKDARAMRARSAS
jgi:glycosyltransferase involved in cell wall biosynthesis